MCSDPHPREGTETSKDTIPTRPVIVTSVLTLIPARGRKQVLAVPLAVERLLECSDPHPREGTETNILMLISKNIVHVF